MMTKQEGKAFFLNFAMDISPSCDCYGWTDTPIVNGLGILASYDPVAVDKACIDMMNAAPGLLNSEAEDFGALACGAKKLSKLVSSVARPPGHGYVNLPHASSASRRVRYSPNCRTSFSTRNVSPGTLLAK